MRAFFLSNYTNTTVQTESARMLSTNTSFLFLLSAFFAIYIFYVCPAPAGPATRVVHRAAVFPSQAEKTAYMSDPVGCKCDIYI